MSLIELMIAMVLGLIVAGAAVALFATNRLTYTATESLGRIQESNRVAFELLSRDLRDTGGNPCDSSLSGAMVNGVTAPTGAWWKNWDNGLRGYDGAVAFTDGLPPFGTATGNRVAGTDAIELKSATATDSFVSADVSDANRSAAIPVSQVTGLTNNDLLVVCDYHGGTIFQATGFAGNTILHAGGAGPGAWPGNVDGQLDLGGYAVDRNGVATPAITMNAVIAKLRSTRWYIGCNGRVACDQPGGRSLYQMRMTNNAGTWSMATDEIAAGASSMDLTYLTSLGTAYGDEASVAATTGTWSTVVGIRISLTFTSQDKAATNGNAISRTVVHVVSLRDHLP